MSEIQAVYRSNHPLVLEFWAESQRRAQAYHDALDAFKAELPEGAQLIESKGFGGRRLVGVCGVKESELGDLWKQKGRDWFWSPLRKTPAGKALGKRLDAISFNSPKAPAMPGFTTAGLTMHSAGYEQIGDDVWCVWAAPAANVEIKPFDPAIWTRAKLWEYYQAREGADAREAVVG